MAILVTWNPHTENPDYSWARHMPNACTLTLAGELVPEDWWNCRTKEVKPGDRLFLLRQRVEPKGIVGSGWVTSPRFKKRMPTTGKMRPVVMAVFDLMLDPDRFPPLDCRRFTKGRLSEVTWDVQFSGMVIPEELDSKWRHHVKKVLGYLPVAIAPDLIDPDELEYPEGRGAFRLHRYIETKRNRELIRDAKAKAKRDGRFYCWVCRFDFGAVYGVRGEGYIEAHHLVLVSELREGDKTKISDLAMVCSNCHRMLHRNPWLTPDQLRELIRN